MKKIPTEVIEAKHEFASHELLELGQKLASAQARLSRLDAERKQAASNYKAKLGTVEEDISELTEKIQNGYEFRSTKCTVALDAKNGEKTYFRESTGERLLTRPMDRDDYQTELLTIEDEGPAAEDLEGQLEIELMPSPEIHNLIEALNRMLENEGTDDDKGITVDGVVLGFASVDTLETLLNACGEELSKRTEDNPEEPLPTDTEQAAAFEDETPEPQEEAVDEQKETKPKQKGKAKKGGK